MCTERKDMTGKEASKNEARERISYLTRFLTECNQAYYVEDAPKISDYEFDMLLKELEGLEKQYPDWVLPGSPTQRVGGEPVKDFPTVVHSVPMLSLGNTYSREEVAEFDARLRKLSPEPFDYVCELKYDGLSISLTYDNGVLVQAVTRGDGIQGDEVTANAGRAGRAGSGYRAFRECFADSRRLSGTFRNQGRGPDAPFVFYGIERPTGRNRRKPVREPAQRRIRQP